MSDTAMRGKPQRVAREARRRLRALSRPAKQFDASRYFRGGHDLAFYNVGMAAVRTMAASIVASNRADWSVDDAIRFAEALMPHRALEVKALAIEVVARYRRTFRPALLGTWKKWLAKSLSNNWATTDAISGALIGPLVWDHPQLALRLRAWARSRNLWVRRAAAVSLIASLRRGRHLDLGYALASQLHLDRDDLIQKAVGWMLREAGKPSPARLEHYLRANGPRIPRTTVRYAIERFPPAARQRLLKLTRARREGASRARDLRFRHETA